MLQRYEIRDDRDGELLLLPEGIWKEQGCFFTVPSVISRLLLIPGTI